MMESALLRKPTLFWGYGFHDGSVSGAIDNVLAEGKQDIWIQLRAGNPDIEYYRDLGCNVIVADTDVLLKEIEEYFATEKDETLTIYDNIIRWFHRYLMVLY